MILILIEHFLDFHSNELNKSAKSTRHPHEEEEDCYDEHNEVDEEEDEEEDLTSTRHISNTINVNEIKKNHFFR